MRTRVRGGCHCGRGLHARVGGDRSLRWRGGLRWPRPRLVEVLTARRRRRRLRRYDTRVSRVRTHWQLRARWLGVVRRQRQCRRRVRRDDGVHLAIRPHVCAAHTRVLSPRDSAHPVHHPRRVERQLCLPPKCYGLLSTRNAPRRDAFCLHNGHLGWCLRLSLMHTLRARPPQPPSQCVCCSAPLRCTRAWAARAQV